MRNEQSGGLYNLFKVDHNIGPGIGIGNKSDFSQNINKNNPSPNTYKIISSTEQSLRDKRGITIGIRYNKSVKLFYNYRNLE